MEPKVKVDISSSNHDVIASGTVLTYGNNGDVTLNVQLDDFHFTVILKFEYEGNGKKQELRSEESAKNTITFTCVNFNNPFGTGATAPMPIGSFMRRKLLINFWVSICGNNEKEALRKIEYSFYLEKGE